MTQVQKKVGVPAGTVNNPEGRNQWAGDRSEKPIAVRLQKDLDEWVREQADERGLTLTQVIEEAIAAHIKREQPTIVGDLMLR